MWKLLSTNLRAKKGMAICKNVRNIKAWKEAITEVRGCWVSPPSVHPSIKIITTNTKIEIGIDTCIINIDFRKTAITQEDGC